MKQQDTDRLADRIFNMLQGPPNNWVDTTSIADVADEFHSSVLRALKESKEAARDLLRLAVEDPDHVPADGLQDRYKGVCLPPFFVYPRRVNFLIDMIWELMLLFLRRLRRYKSLP